MEQILRHSHSRTCHDSLVTAMKGHDVVAAVVVVSGTVLGAVQLLTGGDGAVITAMVGLYGAVLGYAFGKHQAEE